MTVRYLWSCCDVVVNEVADGHCDAVMELVIVSQNYQFQHYTHFHEAKKKLQDRRRTNAQGRV